MRSSVMLAAVHTHTHGNLINKNWGIKSALLIIYEDR